MSRFSFRQLTAWAFFAAGLLANPWLIGRFSSDGKIDNVDYLITIYAFEAALIAIGLLLLKPNNFFRYLAGAAVATFATLIAVSGVKYFNTHHTSEENRDLQLLRHVDTMSARRDLRLDHETSEILYAPHRPTEVVPFTIPANGVFDGGVAVDPTVKEIYKGEVTFEIAVSTEAEGEERIWRQSWNLAKDKEAFRWNSVNLDLSKWAEQDVHLIFHKSASGEARELFDIDPTDFMVWRKPRVRPRNLPDAKNVLLISLDTLRADHLGVAGYHRDTSANLDAFAAEGVWFENCFSQAPWTTPSHFSMLTGTYPRLHQGNKPIQQRQRSWNNRVPIISRLMSDVGYQSVAFTGRGSISAEFGFHQGFDFYNETPHDDQGADFERGLRKVETWLRRNRERSFFMFLHTYEPHGPFVQRHYVDAEGIAEDDQPAYTIGLYDGDIRYTDELFAELRALLEELDLLDDTLVAITSDHGEEFREGEQRPYGGFHGHGHTLYDDQTHVPLILYGFDQPEPGVRVSAQVRSIDIVPTILDQLGLEIPESMPGESLRELITGESTESRPVFSEATTFGPTREGLRADGFKYIHRTAYGMLPEHGTDHIDLTPIHELYDLNADPLETKDLAEQMPEQIEAMRKILAEIFPDGAFSTGSVDAQVQDDPDLLDALRNLGYLD